MSFRRVLAASAFLLLILRFPVNALVPGASTDSITVQRVDAFISKADRDTGLLPADRYVPGVRVIHATHEKAKVACAVCHHKKDNDDRIKQCAPCHKGKAGELTIHKLCTNCHAKNIKAPQTCNGCHKYKTTTRAEFIRFRLYDIVRGPGFALAFIVFALGFVFRLVQFRRLTRLTERNTCFPTPAKPKAVSPKFRFRRTIFGTQPVMGFVSLAFHILLFLTPLLLPAHNILFNNAFGIGLFTLPETLLDKLTVALLCLGGFFLLRRIFVPSVRMLTTLRDYGLLLLVAAPFVTAYMAYHQMFDYRTVLLVHMIIGEIVIMAIPFTRLGHMPFFLFARYFVRGEYSIKPGSRRWQ